METGIVLDGDLRGIYIAEDIQTFAIGYGYPGKLIDLNNEFAHEACDDAIEWLNDKIAEPNHSFYLDEGSLFYEMFQP